MNLIQELRQYLANENIDYLLVNATNEFLVEYSKLNENSRYFLTNFSGSTGDALLSQKDLFLFVDGRYHQQAEQESNGDVKVVKMKLNQSFLKCLLPKLKKNKTIGLVAKKNSQGRVEILETALSAKNIKIKLLDTDPIFELVKPTAKEQAKSAVELVDINIAGVSAEEKLKLISAKIEPNEAILTTNLEEVSYLCNLRDFSSNYSSQIEAKCLIMKEFAVIFTDKPVAEFSKKFKILNLNKFEDYLNNLTETKTIYVDKNTINAFDYGLLAEKSDFLQENDLKTMKSIKNDCEINHYKTCFQRTDKALSATRDFIMKNKSISEFDIAKKLEEEFYKSADGLNGAKSLSFHPIVAKDANSALAHYSNNSKDEIIKDGSLVLIDCGAYYEGGYATDITRVFVKGEATKLQKKVYTVVLKGFLAAFNKKITEKTSGFALDKTARKVLDEFAPRGFNFSHALGHGIGISVHEAPPNLGLSPASKIPLKENMCFTIEPGLYKKGVGGVRLENSCCLMKEGEKLVVKSFSNMCFEEKLIDFDLLNAREKKWLKSFDVK